MPHLVELLQIKTIVDVPCGDFNYFRDILKDPRMASVHYIGADIVQFLVDALNREFYQPNRIEFMRFDLLHRCRRSGRLTWLSSVMFSSTSTHNAHWTFSKM
jgi:hypothetical protein